MKAEVQDYFDSMAGNYQARSTRGLWAWQRKREAKAVFQVLGQVRGLKALDIGCGSGYYTNLLLEYGASHITAVDQSSLMLSSLPQDDRVKRIQSKVESLDIPTRFSVQICTGLLEFVDSPLDVLTNLRRHATPRGRLVCLVPPDNFSGRMYSRFHARHGLKINLFTLESLEAIATCSDWRITCHHTAFPFGLVLQLEAHGDK